MNKTDCANRRIDVLAIGLFGLAVGALTVGLAQIGRIPEADKIGVLVIALVFGGLVQVLAGITDIRYNEQLGGTALTMYGFFWVTVSTAKLLSEGTSFHFDDMLYIPIELVYLVFSAVMIYLTAFRSATLSFLHVIITMTFLACGMLPRAFAQSPSGIPAATAPDNTGINTRDRADNAMTAGSQSGSKGDNLVVSGFDGSYLDFFRPTARVICNAPFSDRRSCNEACFCHAAHDADGDRSASIEIVLVEVASNVKAITDLVSEEPIGISRETLGANCVDESCKLG